LRGRLRRLLAKEAKEAAEIKATEDAERLAAMPVKKGWLWG